MPRTMESNKSVKYLVTPKEYAVFSIALILGALIWILSPIFTGQQEPWDSNGVYYIVSLLVAGGIVGAINCKRVWRWAMAIYIGQLIFLVFMSMGPLLFTGLFFLGGYSLVAYAGAALTASLVKWYS